MSSTRIVSVFCATGSQGSSAVAALLKNGTFTPRALTRDPTSEAALRLKASDVEVVQVDVNDKASIVSALRGSEAVFGVTVLERVPGDPTEYNQGKNMIDAAKEVGVKFFVFSSLPSFTKLSGGKLTAANPFEAKARIQEYLESSGIPNASLFLGGFLENLWTFGALKKTPAGFEMAIPNYSATAKASLTWVGRDVGQSVLVLLKNYTDSSKSVAGKSYTIMSAVDSYPALAALISKALGVEVTFNGAPSGMAIIDEMYGWVSDNNGMYPDDPVLNPDLVALGAKFGTMEEFLEEEIKPRFGQASSNARHSPGERN
ncbi:hypothetical protein C8R44DRAFT_985563 [Mycena epipterygia]|nr:hypothetical protein C8R44DRAFT_985563 [Mycena epipterygia]